MNGLRHAIVLTPSAEAFERLPPSFRFLSNFSVRQPLQIPQLRRVQVGKHRSKVWAKNVGLHCECETSDRALAEPERQGAHHVGGFGKASRSSLAASTHG